MSVFIKLLLASVVAVYNVRVVLKVNQFTIFADYAPTSAGFETPATHDTEQRYV